jgi:hypothetical protein
VIELYRLAVRSDKEERIVTHHDILWQQVQNFEDYRSMMPLHPSQCRRVINGSGHEKRPSMVRCNARKLRSIGACAGLIRPLPSLQQATRLDRVTLDEVVKINIRD